MAFDPREHLSKIKGKNYLEVKWRQVWFRKENPKGRIETNILNLDTEKESAMVRCEIYDDEGTLLGTGHKQEAKANLNKMLANDYLEKAETGAIGRALANAGYGTQFSDDFDEGGVKVVDSPVKPKAKKVINPLTKIRKHFQSNEETVTKLAYKYLKDDDKKEDITLISELENDKLKELLEEIEKEIKNIKQSA